MKHRPRRRLIMIVLCLCTLVLTLDVSVLTVAIPPLARDLGATPEQIQWVFDSYVLVYAGLLMTSGSLSDRFGRRRVLLIGLVVFGLSSLAASLSASVDMLIASRVAMGVGGCLIMPSTLSILITVFDAVERRRAIAIWTVVLMVGDIAGPTVGGLLVSAFWWGAVFLINVPVVVVAMAAALLWMPESKGPWRKPDPLGTVLSVVGTVTLTWMIIGLPGSGVDGPRTLGLLAVAVISLGGFVVWEKRTRVPMVPLALFGDRNFSGGSLVAVLMQVGSNGLVLALPQFLQFVLGFTPAQSGLAMVPYATGMIVSGILGSRMGGKLGNRPMIVLGVLIAVCGLGVLAIASPVSGYGLIAVSLTLFGLGGGFSDHAASNALMSAVPEERAGVGSALNDTVQQVGAAFGVAVLGSVLAAGFSAAMPASAPGEARASINGALAVANRTGDAALAHAARDAFASGMSVTALAGAGVALIAAIVGFVLVRDHKGSRQRPAEPVAETALNGECSESSHSARMITRLDAV